MSRDTNLCAPLPAHLTKRVIICENREQYIVNFLQNLLPSSDCKAIPDEMRKTFILNKFKVKHKQKLNYSGKFLSARKRLQLGLGKISNNNHIKYSDILPLHQLWLQYMREMFGHKSFVSIPKDYTNLKWEDVNHQLIKADLHGAEISVVRSKCPTLVGLTGIIIQDTKNIFRICGKDNIIRTIPKEVVIIHIYLDNGVILKSFGKQLSVRPAERTIKKFKNSRIVQL